MSSLKDSLVKLYHAKKDNPNKPDYWESLVEVLRLEELIPIEGE